LGKFEAQET